MSPEIPDHQSPHKLRRLLIQRINHLSDQLAVETLRLFQGLLKLAYQPIIDTLVVRNFQSRNYLDLRRIKSKSTTRTSSVSSTASSRKIDTGAKSETASIVGDTNTEISPKNDEKFPETKESSEKNDNDSATKSSDSKNIENDSEVANDTEQEESNSKIENDENISEETSSEQKENIVNETSDQNTINPLAEEKDGNPSNESTPVKDDNASDNTQPVETKSEEKSNSKNTPENTEISENTELKNDNEIEQILNESAAASLLDQPTDSVIEEAVEELDGTDAETLDYLNSPKGFNKRKVEKAVNGY